MYDSFSLSTHVDIQKIVKSDTAQSSDAYSFHQGLYSAWKVVSELYPAGPMPEAIHHALLLAMDEATEQMKLERADGLGPELIAGTTQSLNTLSIRQTS